MAKLDNTIGHGSDGKLDEGHHGHAEFAIMITWRKQWNLLFNCVIRYIKGICELALH